MKSKVKEPNTARIRGFLSLLERDLEEASVRLVQFYRKNGGETPMEVADFERLRIICEEIISLECQGRSNEEASFISCLPLGLQCVVVMPFVANQRNKSVAEIDRYRSALKKILSLSDLDKIHSVAQFCLGDF